jgi:hypothetical protein
MIIISGGNFSWTRGVKYPIVISEDTEYRGANFSQEHPHTDGVFAVAPGVVLRFVVDEDGTHCNLTNLTVPDGAIIEGGNLSHGTMEETGDPKRPEVRMLCECDKCAPAWAQINEDIEAGELPKNDKGHILHHEMKERIRARKEFEMLVESDVADLVAVQDATRAKFPGGK